MRPRCLGRYILSIGTAAFLAACGGAQPPITGSGVNAQRSTAGVSKQGRDLLYVAESVGVVNLISYPRGEKVGSIDYGLYSSLGGECTDRAGNVWITDYGLIDEFSPGGTKPIWEKGAKWYLSGCSVAAKTNDVAAVGQHGTVLIWSNGRGKAKAYHTKSFYTLRYCGYDDAGNLFVDGFEPYNNHNFVFFELPSGGKRLIRVSLNLKIEGAGQVQWDGRYVAIQDSDAPYNVYQVKVSGSTGSVVNTIALDGLHKPVTASWIVGSTLFVPYSARGKYANAIGVFNYPSGGKPTYVLHGKSYRYVIAAALSK
jgi:hypothetical protein